MRVNPKALIAGFIIGVLAIYASAVYAAGGGIRYAVYNGVKVIYNGRVLNLGGKRLVSVATEGERFSSNYMPARAVFEAMGLDVGWNPESRTVAVTGQPGATDYEALYWQSLPQETAPAVEAAPAPAYAARPAITVPAGLSERERASFRLMAEIMTAEMDADTGLASIINVAKGGANGSAETEKQLSQALYEAMNAGIAEGSKKVMGVIEKPGASSAQAYTIAYNNFSHYSAALEKALSSLKSANLGNAFTYFDDAYSIYMSF